MFEKALIGAFLVSTAILAATPAMAGAQIRIVGSSTVFPFAAAVAERFGKSTGFATPVVESTGTGGGFKLFCSGADDNAPDISNASRAIKSSEIEACAANGITEIVEIKIGYDGIVIANSRQAEPLELTLRDVYLALARDVPDAAGGTMPNPYLTWRDVNPDLPDRRIEVMGPPPTSGTRDAFVELAMAGGCTTFDSIAALKKQDKSAFKTLCYTLREDGAFIEAGENDNLMVQKLRANPDALAIFGFSFLDQNTDTIQSSTIDGVAPEFDLIANGDYPVSRSLYIYVKKSRIGQVEGLAEYLAEFTSERAWGPEGYLADKGLIPMSEAERAEWAKRAASLQSL
jgi:phosphate transport system substrate-binding protein